MEKRDAKHLWANCDNIVSLQWLSVYTYKSVSVSVTVCFSQTAFLWWPPCMLYACECCPPVGGSAAVRKKGFIMYSLSPLGGDLESSRCIAGISYLPSAGQWHTLADVVFYSNSFIRFFALDISFCFQRCQDSMQHWRAKIKETFSSVALWLPVRTVS